VSLKDCDLCESGDPPPKPRSLGEGFPFGGDSNAANVRSIRLVDVAQVFSAGHLELTEIALPNAKIGKNPLRGCACEPLVGIQTRFETHPAAPNDPRQELTPLPTCLHVLIPPHHPPPLGWLTAIARSEKPLFRLVRAPRKRPWIPPQQAPTQHPPSRIPHPTHAPRRSTHHHPLRPPHSPPPFHSPSPARDPKRRFHGPPHAPHRTHPTHPAAQPGVPTTLSNLPPSPHPISPPRARKKAAKFSPSDLPKSPPRPSRKSNLNISAHQNISP
jgi:hypothetical protein